MLIYMDNKFAKQRIIKDIVDNDDTRIQITGYIKKIVSNNHLVLDDNTGEIKVILENFDLNFKETDLINVIGDLEIFTDGERAIHPDIIQDMNKLNFKYYQRLYELKVELKKE